MELSFLINSVSVFYVLQLVSCAFMTGLIWIVQILHYPSFAFVNEDQFLKFHKFHTNKISYIVMPIMLIELVTAVVLIVLNQKSIPFLLNILFLITIWLSTFFLSVPLHNDLAKNRNLTTINRLIKTNWYRTFLWTVRLCILSYVFLKTSGVNNVNFSN